MTNGEMAQQARDLAVEAIKTRRAALVAATALDESKSLLAAYMIVRGLADKTLAERATDLLDQLAAATGPDAAQIAAEAAAGAQ